MALPILDKMAGVAASTGSATKNLASKLSTPAADNNKIMAKQQSFFDKMLASDRDKAKRDDAKQLTNDVIARQDKNIEQKRLLRHISNNTDLMVDLLRDFKGDTKKNNSSLLDMLKWLIPGLLAIPALLDPEKTKKYQAGTKAAIKGVPVAIKAAEAAATAAQAKKAAQAAEAAKDVGKIAKAGDTAADLAKAAGALGTTAKVLSKVGGAAGKFADSKLVNNGLRLTTAGMAAGRAIQGDYTGAGMEVASQGLTEVARKVKNPKAKLALTLASLGTDAAIIGRDLWNGKKEADREQFAKENGITTPEKESTITKLLGWAGVENDQAKRIKEQKAAMTPEQEAIMAAYDKDGGSGPGGLASVGAITKIVTGVVLGVLAGLGIKSLINKRLGVPDVPGTGSSAGGDIDANGKRGPTKKGGPAKKGGKLGAIKSLAPMAANSMVAAPAGRVPGSIVSETSEAAAKNAGKQVLTKGGAKAGAKLIPGVGLALGAYGAVSRASDGDYTGAALEAISGIATLVPVAGTAIGAVIQGGLLYRDYVKATSQDAAAINTIAKDSAGKLGDTATAVAEGNEISKELIDKNSSQITDTNKTLSRNSDDMAKTISETDNKLSGFTTLFGTSLMGWLGVSGIAFTKASQALSSVAANIGNKLVEWGKDKLNSFTETGSDGAYTGTADKGRLKTELGQGVISNKNLGVVSASFESGNRGVGTVSTGKGDHGGVSYGAHQMTAATMTKFLNSKHGAPFKADLAKYKPGTKQFDSMYKTIAKHKGPAFEKAQHDFISQNYFGVANDIIKKKTGVDVARRGRALQEMLYSTAVQYGPERAAKWVIDVLTQNKNMKDADIIASIQNHKAKHVNTHFRNSSESTRKAVANRIQTEKTMLLNIDAKNPGPAATGSAGTSTPAPKPAATPPATKGSAPAGGVAKEATNGNKSAATSAGSLSNATDTATGKNSKAGMEWDLDAMCSYAVANAKAKSLGKCALYVRKALEAGKLKNQFSGGLGDAKDVPKRLVKMGWSLVGENITSFKKGDIAVFPKTKSQYGHICIFTGSGWVSDYKQNKLQPYNSVTFPYNVYRAQKGYSNGSAVSFTGDADMESGSVDDEGNPIGGAGDDSGNSGEEPQKNAGEKLIDGMAALMAWAGDSDTMKAAVDWLDSVEKDGHSVRQMDAIEMEGFDKKLYGQLDNGHKYKYGNGGGINEDELFNPNLDRQKGASSDLLGEAGKINGIQRQQNVGRNLLGEAGYVNPNTRQLGTKRDLLGEAGAVDPNTRQLASKYDLLGEAGYVDPNTRQLDVGRNLLGEAGSGRDLSDVKGTGGYGDLNRNTRLDDIIKELDGTGPDGKKASAEKKKKLKWYDKLFGDSNSWLGQLANGLGFGGLFGSAQEIYNTSKTGDWGKYAMDKGTDILTNNGMGELAGIGNDIYNTSQTGNSSDWGGLAARTLETIYSHKDDHLKDANGNIITTTNNDTVADSNNVSFSDIVNETGGILPITSDPGLVLPGMAEAGPAAPPILEPIAENNIIPTVKEDTNGNRTYYNGDGSTVTRDFEGKLINQTPPTTDVPNRFEDVKPRIVAPGEENQVKPMAMVEKKDASKGEIISQAEALAPAPANPALAAAMAQQNQYDNAFAKLRKDKIASGEIGAHTSAGQPISLTPNNTLENGVLQPDMEGRATLDDHVAKINRQYEQSKHAASANGTPNTNVPLDGSTSSIAPPSAGNKNGGDGNTAPIVTRNPDSIFREVSMTMMRASTT